MFNENNVTPEEYKVLSETRAYDYPESDYVEIEINGSMTGNELFSRLEEAIVNKLDSFEYTTQQDAVDQIAELKKRSVSIADKKISDDENKKGFFKMSFIKVPIDKHEEMIEKSKEADERREKLSKIIDKLKDLGLHDCKSCDNTECTDRKG